MSASNSDDIFAEIRKHATSKDKVKSENFKVLSDVEQSITNGKKKKISFSKYFEGIMTQLDSNPENVRSLLYLLQTVLPNVPDKLKTEDRLGALLKVYVSCQSRMEPASIRSMISCLVLILLFQEMSSDAWNQENVKKSFRLLLSFCIHENGKVRRHSQEELLKIMMKHHEAHFAVTSEMIVSYLNTLKEQFDDEDYKDISYFLAFVAQCASLLDASQYETLLQLLLELRSHKLAYMDTNSLKPIKVILRNSTQISPKLVRSTLEAILSDPPTLSATPVDVQEFVTTVLSCCQQLSIPSDWNLVYQSVEKAVVYIQMKEKEVATSVSQSLISYFRQLSFSNVPQKALAKVISLFVAELAKHNKELTLSVCTAFINSVDSSHSLVLKPLLDSLVSLRCQSSNSGAEIREHLDNAIGSIVEKMGLKVFINQLSFIQKGSLPNSKLYFIFSILSKSLCHTATSLADFFSIFSPVLKACHSAVESTENGTQKRQYEREISNIWTIFASCCVSATDIPEVLPSYRKALIKAMKDNKNIEAGQAISRGLALLVLSNQHIDHSSEKEKVDEDLIDEDDKDEHESKVNEDIDLMDENTTRSLINFVNESRAPKLSPEQSAKAIDTIRGCCDSFIRAVLDVYYRSHGPENEEIVSINGVGKNTSISAVLLQRSILQILFSVAPSSVVSEFFTQSLQSLQLVDGAPAVSRDLLVTSGLLSAVIPSISSSEVEAAYAFFMSPSGKSRAPSLQRRLSFALLHLCKFHSKTLLDQSLLLSLSNDLLNRLLGSDVVIRQYCLKSLLYLWDCLSPESSEHIQMIIQTLPQLSLCIKDANKKVRSLCFEALILLSEKMNQSTVSISLANGDETPASLNEFLKVLMGGLAVETSRMRSASLMCISCVLYHHRSNPSIVPTINNVMHIVYDLLESKSRELAKACFGFLRTCVKVLPEEMVREEMHDVMASLLPWANDTQNRFKLRVKGIIELFLRRIGKQEVEKTLPEDEKSLLEQILHPKKGDSSKTDEQFVKEMEEGAAMEDGLDDDMEVLEIDENGNIIGNEEQQKREKVELKDLVKEIKENEGWKRITKRNMSDDGSKRGNKRMRVEEKPSKKAVETEKKEEQKIKKDNVMKEKEVKKETKDKVEVEKKERKGKAAVEKKEKIEEEKKEKPGKTDVGKKEKKVKQKVDKKEKTTKKTEKGSVLKKEKTKKEKLSAK